MGITPGMFAAEISGHLFSPAGAFDALSFITLSGTPTTAISFTSIPQTYTHLQIRAYGRVLEATNSSNILFTFNSDSGSNYSYEYLYNSSNTTVGGGATNPNAGYGLGFRFPGTSNTASHMGHGYMNIPDYSSTTKNKSLSGFTGHDGNSGFPNGQTFYWASDWTGTAAISTITLSNTTGFASGSVFTLYGIR